MTTLEQLKPLLIEAGTEEERITSGARLVEDLGLDSIDMVLIKCGIETNFDLPSGGLDEDKFETVGDIVARIEHFGV